MKQKFAHLHVHTDNSALDGLGRIPAYVARGKKLGQDFMAITDHGNIAGTYEFYKECKDQGVAPVLGEEFYFVPEAEHVKEDKNAERFHIVILARNQEGFRTLVELTTEAHKRFYYKPLIDRPLLESLGDDAKNLTVLSGCAGSILSRKALKAVPGSARKELEWWTSVFPNFYVELQSHGTSFDRKLNARLVKLAKEQGVPWVITNDPHYVTKDQAHDHDCLLAIQTASDLDDPERFRFDGTGYHLRSAKEMVRAFEDYKRSVWKPGLDASMDIAKDCAITIDLWDARQWHIPAFPKTKNPEKALRKVSYKGLEEHGLAKNKVYKERVEHELEQFRNVGMENFLLITRDAVRAAKRKGIRVGPGRGSVCGTLVGYLIGIHKIDPIRYDLLFERFLNPERPKMPDVDTDFQGTRRDEMFRYTENLYGRNNTMRVGAYQKLRIKAAFKSIAKAHGIDFKDANRLSKEILEDEDGDAVLPKEVMEGYPELADTLNGINGTKRDIARHPAGIIVFDPKDPIRDLIPLQYIPSSKKFVSQFDLDAAAGIGLLKQDFLSLRTLDTIQECVNMISEKYGIDLEPDDWIPDEQEHDKKVYRMLAKGDCYGVFQMEGGTNHRGIQEMGCKEFEDIVACTSLYRAGPMIAGAPKRYMQNRKDGKVRVAHSSLKPYLSKTWGEMIYQEQMFEILFNVAGLSWARVDDVKTAMAKKDQAKMDALMPEVIEGFCSVGGMDESKAKQTAHMIASQAAYLFNRSHAVAYSYTTYQTARLKYLYPLEFTAALLRTVEGANEAEKEKREKYMGAAIRRGFKILPPDIDLSDAKFTPVGDDTLLFGFQDISGIGESAAKKLVESRPKKGFRNYEEVVAASHNKKTVNALEQAGALTKFGIKPDDRQQEEVLKWAFEDHMEEYRKKYEKKVKLPTAGKDGTVDIIGELVKIEKSKTKGGKPYMKWTLRWAPGIEFRATLWSETSPVWDTQKGSIVRVVGKWQSQWDNVGVGDVRNIDLIKRLRKTAAA